MQLDIARHVSRRPQRIESLCTKLACSEVELRTGLEKFAAVQVVDGWVYSGMRTGSFVDAPSFGSVKPGRHTYGFISDIHAGSKGFDGKALQGFVRLAMKRGVDTILIPGDIVDGTKSVLLREQNQTGFDGQLEDLQTWLPKGPQYVAISGNHDGYVSDAAGIDAGVDTQRRMREVGHRWTFLGTCLGFAKVHGARVQMWHPHGGASTESALRGILGNRLRSNNTLTDLLAIGHFHKYVFHALPEGGYGLACPTFQRKKSEFSERIANPWDVGGVIVSHDLDRHGQAKNFAAEYVRL